MGKPTKRTIKLLKNDGKGLRSRLFSRKVKTTVSRRKADKVAKFEKSVTEHISKQAEEDEIRGVEGKASKEADTFLKPEVEHQAEDVFGDSAVLISGSEGDEIHEDDNDDDDEDEGMHEEDFGALGEIVDVHQGEREDSSSEEEPTEMKMDNKNLQKDIHTHKEQLEALKDQDPEFYEYLQQADQNLLAFGDSESENEEESGEENEEFGKPQNHLNTLLCYLERRQLSQERAEELCQAAVNPKGKLEDLKLLLAAYHAACIYGQDSDKAEQVLTFEDSNTYTKIMMFVLKEIDGVFWRLLGIPQSAGKDAIYKTLTSKEKLHKEVCQFYVSTMKLLTEPLDGPMCGFVLRRLRASIPLMGRKAQLMKKVLLCALGFFASEAKSPRVQAIMLIREMVSKLGDSATDMCMKGVYRTFASKANLVNQHSATHLNFMATCVIEIFGLSPEHAYRHGFGFIRNLAIELREAISEKRGESISKVFSWRYINCLELWARLVSTHINLGDMQHLVYPVAQLLLGVIQFRQQKKYLPTRLRVVRTLNGLSTATGFYIPVSSYLLGILQWASQNTKVRRSSDDICPDLSLQLKVAKGRLTSAAFQEEVIEQAFELLAHHLAQWSNSIAFPEMSFWTLFHMKKFTRNTKVERLRKLTRQLVGAVEQCAKNIQGRRDVVDFSPKDTEKVKAFEEEGRQLGKTPLESLSLELERATIRRRDMRLKAEWDMEEENSDDSDSQSSDDDIVNKVSLAVPTATGPSTVPSEKEEDILEDSKLNFDAHGDKLHGESDSDVVEEFVLSDDEHIPSRQSNNGIGNPNGLKKRKKGVKGKGGKRSNLSGASHKVAASDQKRRKRNSK